MAEHGLQRDRRSGGGVAPCRPGPLRALARALAMVLALGGACASGATAGEPAAAPVGFALLKPLLETHCHACHSAGKRKAGVDLSIYADEAAVHRDRATWKKVVEQLESGEMPPENAKTTLGDAQRRQLAEWVRGSLATASAAAARSGDPGPSLIRRLARREYAATLRDLLGDPLGSLDVAEAVGLPEDGERGYATYAGNLTMPPLLFEKYVSAAEQALSALAEPGPQATPAARAAWRQLFGAPPAGPPAARRAAARDLLQAFARRAYRRPVQPDELARLLRLYEAGEARGRDHVGAMKLALTGALASPNFLYRAEVDRAPRGSAESYAVSPHELAVRLSYLLWSSMPDAELSALADRGTLSEPAVLEAQARRLLNDPRARALVDGFFAGWLQIDHLERARPSQQHFPAFTPALRQAMYEETARFIDELRSRDGSLLDLLASDYAYVNADLARHYGLPAVQGDHLRRVALAPGDRRGGLLGMGSVLAQTSHTFRTSPTLRGKWVLEVLLGTPPPPPPAMVDQNIDEAGAPSGAAAAAPTTFRDRLAAHVTDQACAGCHRKMDPLGFALDNYDAVGAWRDSSAERPLDTSGTLPGGERLAGVADLKRVLWERRERVLRNLVAQFVVYALGRDLVAADDAVIDGVVGRLHGDGQRVSTLVLGVVMSHPFRHRRNLPPAPLAAGQRARPPAAPAPERP